MVLLTVTPAIARALTFVKQLSASQKNEGERAIAAPDSLAVGMPISHLQIIALSNTLRKLKEQREYVESAAIPSCQLDHLLWESRVYNEPPKPKAEPTREYVRLMARLRRDEEDRAYERMIRPPPPIETFKQRYPSSRAANLFPPAQADIGEEDQVTYADVNRQMTLILNIMISIVACSVAIWLAARHWSTPSRLGLSMGGSGLIGIGEVVVYAGYLKRVKEAKERGRKEIESKEVVKTWVIGRQEEGLPIVSKSIDDNGIRQRKATSK